LCELLTYLERTSGPQILIFCGFPFRTSRF